jgi:ribonuclease P protein component
MPAFVMEARPRPAAETPAPGPNSPGPRFGFTITKKIGGAVVRNRIRRRLRALVAGLGEAHADHDYVVIARPGAIDRTYQDLKADLEQAVQRIHRPGGRHTRKPR